MWVQYLHYDFYLPRYLHTSRHLQGTQVGIVKVQVLVGWLLLPSLLCSWILFSTWANQQTRLSHSILSRYLGTYLASTCLAYFPSFPSTYNRQLHILRPATINYPTTYPRYPARAYLRPPVLHSYNQSLFSRFRPTRPVLCISNKY